MTKEDRDGSPSAIRHPPSAIRHPHAPHARIPVSPARPGLSRDRDVSRVGPFKSQLLKWVGNKQRFAHEIVSYFPARFGTYHEPFLGSGAVLATLAPEKAVGSDVFKPLVEIWQALRTNSSRLKGWYQSRWELTREQTKEVVYERVKAAYNANPT